MPSKSRRVASRQGQMAKRKRRERSSVDLASPPAAVTGAATTSTGTAEQATATPVQPAPARTATARRPVTTFRGKGAKAQPDVMPPAYTYVGSELRRIGLIVGVIVVALVALTFVLR